MEFLIPTALWSLVGLMIPVLIHLWSRKEKKIIHFGSIRFLESKQPEAASSFQLARYFLLFTRLLFLTVICIFLAQPFLNRKPGKIFWIESNSTDYLQIEGEGLFPENEVEVRQFMIGDETEAGIASFPSIWTFVEYLNGLKDSSEVYASTVYSQMKGSKVRHGTNVKWNVLPVREFNGPESDFILGDRLASWSIMSNERMTGVEILNKGQEAETASSDAYTLKFWANKDHQNNEELQAFVDLISEMLVFETTWVDEVDSADVYFHIGDDNPLFIPSITWIPSDSPIKIEGSSNSRLEFSGSLDRDEILNKDIPVRMASLFNRTFTGIDNFDLRVIPKSHLIAEGSIPEMKKEKSTPSQASFPLTWWLILIPILGFERYLSHSKS